jgi:hypothetical protein
MTIYWKKLTLVWILVVSPAMGFASPGESHGLTKLGEGQLRWFGLSIYTASLWTQPETTLNKFYETPVLLTIDYDRNISKERILESTRQEWERLDGEFDTQENLWIDSLTVFFPDIKAGDKLSSLVLPDGQTRIYLGTEEIGRVDDPDFGPAFLSIWLDPNARSKPLRKKLLNSLLQSNNDRIAFPSAANQMYGVNGP